MYGEAVVSVNAGVGIRAGHAWKKFPMSQRIDEEITEFDVAVRRRKAMESTP